MARAQQVVRTKTPPKEQLKRPAADPMAPPGSAADGDEGVAAHLRRVRSEANDMAACAVPEMADRQIGVFARQPIYRCGEVEPPPVRQIGRLQ